MLREALDKLGEWARRSEAIKPIEVLDLRTCTLLDVGGKIERIDHEPIPCSHTVHRLEDLASWSAGGDSDGETHDTVAWCDLEQVCLVLDDAGLRRNRVHLPLPPHPKMEVARHFDAQGFHEPRQLVAELRYMYREELGLDLLAKLGSIRTKSTTETRSEQAHGKDGFGKSIDAELMGAADLPETVALMLPVWATLDYRTRVSFALQIDTFEGKLRFSPEPGELERVQVEAIAWLTAKVEDHCDGRVMAGRHS